MDEKIALVNKRKRGLAVDRLAHIKFSKKSPSGIAASDIAEMMLFENPSMGKEKSRRISPAAFHAYFD